MPLSNSKRVAIIYWPTSSVGGIATHLNSLRTVALQLGDSCDILRSGDHKTIHAQKFSERKWIRGGDTNIWIDGELPHHPNQIEESLKFLKKNYDAIHFGFLCPHPTKAYPEPTFLSIFEDSSLPKTGTITDGYWEDYEEWGRKCLPHLNLITTVNDYCYNLIEEGFDVKNLGQPFLPGKKPYKKKSKKPLLIWPNQWKNIKGINPFLEAIPQLPSKVKVELYSCGIRYYQLRTQDVWKEAVGVDHFKGFNGDGQAPYFGNVDLDVIQQAFQRAWFTVCLQGMKTRKETYKRGSFNYTELEALYYGALPILHETALNTDLPEDCIEVVSTGEELPEVIAKLVKEKESKRIKRREKSKKFVEENYSARTQYLTIRKAWK